MRVFRYLKYLFLGLVGLALGLMAFANWEPVTVQLIHTEVSAWVDFNYSITAPLFLVIFASVMVGILVGFVLEWLREYHYRAEAKTQRRTAKQLEREVKTLKGSKTEHQDDVLALLDESSPAR